MTEDPERLLTTKEAAAALGISPGRLARLTNHGVANATRGQAPGRRRGLRYTAAEVERLRGELRALTEVRGPAPAPVAVQPAKSGEGVERLLTTREVAAALAVSPYRVRELVSRGFLQPVLKLRHGRHLYYDHTAVERLRQDLAWLAQARGS